MLLRASRGLTLAVILSASRDGLTAAGILARTQGSIAWAAFYGLFVFAAAVHAPIGLRNVIRETTPWQGRGLDLAMVGVFFTMFALGLRAVVAVVGT